MELEMDMDMTAAWQALTVCKILTRPQAKIRQTVKALKALPRYAYATCARCNPSRAVRGDNVMSIQSREAPTMLQHSPVTPARVCVCVSVCAGVCNEPCPLTQFSSFFFLVSRSGNTLHANKRAGPECCPRLGLPVSLRACACR